jgi:hypothetical protein
MKVYVTKYALTQGIFPIEANLIDDGKYAKQSTGSSLGLFLRRGEYALTDDEAIRQAEELRCKKLASIEKQVSKINQLDFRGMLAS